MKSLFFKILDHLKQTVFVAIILSMVSQPILQSVSYMIDNDIKIVQVELDEDSDEETNEDNKEEKIEFKTQKIYTRFSDNNLLITSNFFKEELLSDMSLEIIVPPPQKS